MNFLKIFISLLDPVGDPCITGTNVCLQECKSYGDGVYQCLCSKGYKDITTKSYPPSSLIQTGLNCTGKLFLNFFVF